MTRKQYDYLSYALFVLGILIIIWRFSRGESSIALDDIFFLVILVPLYFQGRK